ncbi:MAG: hypothetical protein U5L45_24640 [Saprospiraceae bacterium]|nr:hypothetical protein [Saprospiraceae bacterium]
METFGLERLYYNTPIMNDWLSATGDLTDFDKALLNESQAKLIRNADAWNEEELKMNFISFIIFLARYDDPIRTYYDRELSVKIGDFTLICKADMLLSSGIGELIKTPYFFLHEYKREKKYSGDPIGQMLGGMLIGQAKNNNDKLMYGCYVQGRFWFFSILDGKKYVISQSFDSANAAAAEQIVMILRRMKEIIHTTLM